MAIDGGIGWLSHGRCQLGYTATKENGTVIGQTSLASLPMLREYTSHRVSSFAISSLASIQFT